MSVLARSPDDPLPPLSDVDAEITATEDYLHRLRVFRQGVALIQGVTQGLPPKPSEPATDAPIPQERLSARECLVHVLRQAGQPLPWDEIQRRVARLPHPPTASAITSAYYHNTKSGTQEFLPVGEGYAGLRGRDEEWEAPEPSSNQMPGTSGPGSGLNVKALVIEYLRQHPVFFSRDVVNFVVQRLPDANIATIRAQLSHCGKRGEAELQPDGRWVSKLFNSQNQLWAGEEGAPETD